ncbi:MAG: HAMP domain-containing sensor histidine kinase [Candidatus Peribacteraceae bacterium]|nr:HAMP domain-containing sensor histidine kinase [Candidatus Peribacteraceae bacterium]
MRVLQDLDRQKDELLGIVSHQLAKPITAIKWTLESLSDGDAGELTTEQRECMDTMQSMAVNLADLVGMILDVSRVQLGRIKLDPQPLDLNTFFKEVVDVIRPAANQKHLTLTLNIPAQLPTVLLDKRYTRMTVENLLTNAVKYTPEGGTVTLNVSHKSGKLLCDIGDTGCGIPHAEQSKIFGKMFRASNVRNTADGNGFGLFVAKGAVEAQGGRIGFVSTEGKGTTFSVVLPAKTAAGTALHTDVKDV